MDIRRYRLTRIIQSTEVLEVNSNSEESARRLIHSEAEFVPQNDEVMADYKIEELG